MKGALFKLKFKIMPGPMLFDKSVKTIRTWKDIGENL